MLTRDEVVQLILYLIVATVLLLATGVRADTIEYRSCPTVGDGVITASAR